MYILPIVVLGSTDFCDHKSETMQCVGLKIGMGGKHHRYYIHTRFWQNPRGEPKDLTWNDPLLNKKVVSAMYIL